MDIRPHKQSGRLQIFEDITRKGESEVSRSLRISGILEASALLPVLSCFGELMEVDWGSEGLKATYFDIRHASLARNHLSQWFSVGFEEGPSDFMLVPEGALARLENYRALISGIERVGSYLLLTFFDIRVIPLLNLSLIHI